MHHRMQCMQCIARARPPCLLIANAWIPTVQPSKCWETPFTRAMLQLHGLPTHHAFTLLGCVTDPSNIPGQPDTNQSVIDCTLPLMQCIRM
jgi:hypothetical protein